MKIGYPILAALVLLAGCSERQQDENSKFWNAGVNDNWNPKWFNVQIEPSHVSVKSYEPFQLTMTVRNKSKRKREFGIMLCSYLSQWSFSSEQVRLIGTRVCFRNYPIRIKLEPGETYEMKYDEVGAFTDKEKEVFQVQIGFTGLIADKEGQLNTEKHPFQLPFDEYAVASSPIEIEIFGEQYNPENKSEPVDAANASNAASVNLNQSARIR